MGIICHFIEVSLFIGLTIRTTHSGGVFQFHLIIYSCTHGVALLPNRWRIFWVRFIVYILHVFLIKGVAGHLGIAIIIINALVRIVFVQWRPSGS